MGCSKMTSFFWGTLTSPPLNTHHFFTFSIARSKRQGDEKYISVNYYTNKRKWRLCQHCAAISPYRDGWRRVPVNFYDRASSYSILSFRYSSSENHLEEENSSQMLVPGCLVRTCEAVGGRVSRRVIWQLSDTVQDLCHDCTWLRLLLLLLVVLLLLQICNGRLSCWIDPNHCLQSFIIGIIGIPSRIYGLPSTLQDLIRRTFNIIMRETLQQEHSSLTKNIITDSRT